MIAKPASRGPACASDLDLDELIAGDLAGTKEAGLLSHLQGCSDCRARLAAFAAVEPPSWKEIGARLRTRPPAVKVRRWLSAIGLLTAAATALVLIARPHRATAPMVEQTKGSLALTVIVKRASGAVETLGDGNQLRPAEEIRFSATSAKSGYAVVLGLDAEPAVTVYIPTPGALPPRLSPGAGLVLPGSIVADETPGTEKVVLLRCDAQPDASALHDAAVRALAAAGGRPEYVGALGIGCEEASVLLHKATRR